MPNFDTSLVSLPKPSRGPFLVLASWTIGFQVLARKLLPLNKELAFPRTLARKLPTLARKLLPRKKTKGKTIINPSKNTL